MKPLDQASHHADETFTRSLTKTLTYRVFILILDFSVIYLFTRKVSVATGFMIVSNIYTTIGYAVHERIWGRIQWGRRIFDKTQSAA